jgi:hypothetical protein
VLSDEDFVEVHKRGTFGVADIEEVRVGAEDGAVAADILHKDQQGVLPSLAQVVWSSRRAKVATELAARGVQTRVVATTGRTGRWG